MKVLLFALVASSLAGGAMAAPDLLGRFTPFGRPVVPDV